MTPILPFKLPIFTLSSIYFIFLNRINGVVSKSINSVSAGVVTAVRIPLKLANFGGEPAIAPTITFDLPQGIGFIRAYEVVSVSSI